MLTASRIDYGNTSPIIKSRKSCNPVKYTYFHIRPGAATKCNSRADSELSLTYTRKKAVVIFYIIFPHVYPAPEFKSST